MTSRGTGHRRTRLAGVRPGRLGRAYQAITSLLLVGVVVPMAITGSTGPGAAGPAQGSSPVPAAAASPAPLTTARLAHRLSAEVYGFLPYWELDSGTDGYLRYDLLSDIALFSVGLDAAGAVDTTAKGYLAATGPNAASIVANAHAAGVRVDLTFTSFGYAKNAAFFTDSAAMSAGVAALVGLVRTLGLDGVNVDVELLENQYFAPYGAFVGDLRAALRATNPIARVSVATNGSTSGAAMAVQALANGADRAVMMGYNYRTAGTSPVGSIAPLDRTDGGKSLTWTLDTYAGYGIAADRILLGLPYYGRTWATASGDLHAANTGSVGIFYPGDDLAGIPSGTALSTDPVEQSRWFSIQDPVAGTWQQTYFDDPATLAAKYALVPARGLAGVALWALGYDRGLSTYWAALAGSFGTIRVAGADRYATSAAIAAAAFSPGVDTVVVASGLAFPDAVAGSAAAASLAGPLLLIAPAGVPTATVAALRRLAPRRIVIVGGPAVITAGAQDALAAYAGSGGVVRAAGPDRYATAAALSAMVNPVGVPVVYLATGADFADALAAAPAAAHLSGALLLTSPSTLPASTAAELIRLAPARVVIVGSPGAVSTAVGSAVHALLPSATVERQAGPDRYATAAALASAFDGSVPAVWVASGLGYADAVAAAAAAGIEGGPLLLAAPTVLPAVTRDAIARLAPTHAAVAGGPSVISNAVLGAVRTAVATAS